MEATRTRFNSTAEWLTAAAFLIATLVVAALVVRELRVVPQAYGPPSAEPASASPATAASAIPPEAVSVPSMSLSPTVEIRVGEGVLDGLTKLSAVGRLRAIATETGPLGVREVRTYEVGGTEILIVVEPFERRGAPRIAGIYLK
jgi:hypothetical protein